MIGSDKCLNQISVRDLPLKCDSALKKYQRVETEKYFVSLFLLELLNNPRQYASISLLIQVQLTNQ